jgi:hypothetical protein
MVNQDGINGKEVKTLTLANPATLLLRFFIEPVKDWGLLVVLTLSVSISTPGLRIRSIFKELMTTRK